MLVPMVVSRNGNNERVMDIFSKMLDERIIYINGVITAEMAELIVPQLHFLENENSDEDITMLINSPGGSVQAGFAIMDTMNYIACDVSTITLGGAASMGSFLLAAGTKGKRFSLPNTRIMIHSVASGTEGKIQDMKISMQETEYISNKLIAYLAQFTGKTIKRITKDTDRDNFMSAEEAKAYGLIDDVITHR